MATSTQTEGAASSGKNPATPLQDSSQVKSAFRRDDHAIHDLMELNSVLNQRSVGKYWEMALDLLCRLLGAQAANLWLFPSRSGDPPVEVRVGDFSSEHLERIGRWEATLGAGPRDASQSQEFQSTHTPEIQLSIGRHPDRAPILHVQLYSEGLLLGGISLIYPDQEGPQEDEYAELMRIVHLVVDSGLRQRQLLITRTRLDRISLIAQVSQQLNTTLDLETVFQETAELTTYVLEAEAATLFLADERKEELIFYVPSGGAGGALRERRIPMNQGVAGWVATQRQPLIVNDAGADPRFSGHVDADTGFRTKSILCVPLLAQGRLVGVLEVLNKQNDLGFTEEDQNWLETLANQAAIALENARLYQNLRLEQERIIKAQEEVRHQLARDLHDGAAQMLALIIMNVDMARRLLEKERYETVHSELDLLEDLARQANREIRTMLFELRPVILESRGLISALQSYHQQLTGSLAAEVHLEAEELPFELKPQAASNIFSVVQEAVNNIRKYAQANHVWIRVWVEEDSLKFEVEDDGVGFDVNAVQTSYEDRGSFGLLNMRERMEMLGGRLSLVSPSPHTGAGTLIQGRAPVDKIRE